MCPPAWEHYWEWQTEHAEKTQDGKGGSARRGLDKGGLVFEEHRCSLFKDADVQSVAMANELLSTIHAIVETGDYWD